jgi:hypothetical protein
MKRDTPSLLALTEQITQQEELLKQGKRAPPSLALGEKFTFQHEKINL